MNKSTSDPIQQPGRRAKSWIIPALSLLLFCHCGRSRPTSNLSEGPLIVWKKNQTDISHSSNIWNGFSNPGESLLATQEEPRLFFFLKDIPQETSVTAVYKKRSGGPLLLNINGRTSLKMDASPAFRTIQGKVSNLRKGLNFVTFSGPVEGFQLSRLSLGSQPASKETLEKDESFTLALPPGQLSMTLKGSGTFTRIEHRFSPKIELTDSRTYTYRSGFPFYRKKLVSASTFPSLVHITCRRGRITLDSLNFHPAPEPPPVMPSTWKGKRGGNVFIFLWDGCQAKHLGLYGYKRDTAPFLSQFARDALVFRKAYANASFTCASVASLFTGLYPPHHDRLALSDKLHPNVETLGAFFKKHGYSTAAFTANASVSYSSGLGKKIDNFQRLLGVFIKNESHKVVDSFSDWVSKAPAPRFSYVHFMEPHFPLIPPPPFLNQYKKTIRPKAETVIRYLKKKETFTPEEIEDVIADYDSAINYVDSLFRRAVDFLKSQGLYDESLIILLSDHGEACYEHRPSLTIFAIFSVH